MAKRVAQRITTRSSRPTRICSLTPGATEVIMALGLGDQLVGISHVCDYPPEVQGKPVLVRTGIDSDCSSSAEIERQVRAAAEAGQELYEVDAGRLAAASPDLIVAQDLCEVCAITPGKLTAVLQKLPTAPQVLS